MVWIALIYAGAGTFLSAVVGRQLVDQNNRRAAFEAEFRKALVEANTARGTDTVTRQSVYATSWHLYRIFSNVLASTRLIIISQTNLTWISAGFGWGGLVVPVLAAAPAYFSGQLTFGGLMMAVGAFNQVNTALRWQINNFSMIANGAPPCAASSSSSSSLKSSARPPAVRSRYDIPQLRLYRSARDPILNR